MKNLSHLFLFVREFLLQIMNIVFAMGNLEFKISSVILKQKLGTIMIDDFFLWFNSWLLGLSNKQVIVFNILSLLGFSIIFIFIFFSRVKQNSCISSISTNFANLFEQQKWGSPLKMFWFDRKWGEQRKSEWNNKTWIRTHRTTLTITCTDRCRCDRYA